LATHFFHALLRRLLNLLDSHPAVKVETGILQSLANELRYVLDFVRGDHSVLILVKPTDHLGRVKAPSAATSATAPSITGRGILAGGSEFGALGG
jgi:hypothetical protein